MLFFRKTLERTFRPRPGPRPAKVIDVEPARPLRGVDYLLNVAGDSPKTPLLRAFREMVKAEEGDPHPGDAFPEGRRSELTEHELVALAVVGSAAQTAAERGDLVGLKETLQIGLSCALRFVEYIKRNEQ